MPSSTLLHDVGTALMAKILESGRYSDLTIESQGSAFKVHRNIVCLQSKPLAAHVDGQFQVSILVAFLVWACRKQDAALFDPA
jgi:hypothetical protein